MKRARHIVQQLSMKEVAPRESDAVCKIFDAENSLLILEYCKHGNLRHLIERLARKSDGRPPDVAVREQQLVKIFCCRMLFMSHASDKLKSRKRTADTIVWAY